jgi:hypothetical protein
MMRASGGKGCYVRVLAAMISVIQLDKFGKFVLLIPLKISLHELLF